MNKRMENVKGITLIVLVITVIVLLILAGVVIAALSGDNGILNRAVQAKNKTNEEKFIEDIKLEENEYRMAINTGNNNACDELIKRLKKKGYDVTEDNEKVNVVYKEWKKEILKDDKKEIVKYYYSNFEVAWNDANNHNIENADLVNNENAEAYITNIEQPEIYLLKDVIVSKKIDVDCELVLNLNGNTLEFKDETGYGNQKFIYVAENQKLIINDESQNGKIEKVVKNMSVPDYLIAVDGKLYINSGSYNISGNSNKALIGFLIGYSNYNNDNISKDGVYMETSGGKVDVRNDGSGSATGIYCYDKKAEMLIRDICSSAEGGSNGGFGLKNRKKTKILQGNFKGISEDGYGQGCCNYNDAEMEILDGTFYGSNNYYMYGGRGIANEGNLIVRNGNFTGTSTKSSGIGISTYSGGTLEVYGGNFSGNGEGEVSGVGLEVDNNATAIVDGGIFNGESKNSAAYGCRNTKSSKLTIKNGSFTGKSLNSIGYSCYNSSSNISISNNVTLNGEKYGC